MAVSLLLLLKFVYDIVKRLIHDAYFRSLGVLVLIVDPSTQSRAVAAAIQTMFGLTPAEARVAVLIGSGRSGPETAEKGPSPAPWWKRWFRSR